MDLRSEILSGHSLWPCDPASFINLLRESMSGFVNLRSSMLDWLSDGFILNNLSVFLKCIPVFIHAVIISLLGVDYYY